MSEKDKYPSQMLEKDIFPGRPELPDPFALYPNMKMRELLEELAAGSREKISLAEQIRMKEEDEEKLAALIGLPKIISIIEEFGGGRYGLGDPQIFSFAWQELRKIISGWNGRTENDNPDYLRPKIDKYIPGQVKSMIAKTYGIKTPYLPLIESFFSSLRTQLEQTRDSSLPCLESIIKEAKKGKDPTEKERKIFSDLYSQLFTVAPEGSQTATLIKTPEDIETKISLEGVLEKLPPLEKVVVALRFGLFNMPEKNIEEIAEIFGISHETARRFLIQALAKMKSLSGQ